VSIWPTFDRHAVCCMEIIIYKQIHAIHHRTHRPTHSVPIPMEFTGMGVVFCVVDFHRFFYGYGMGMGIEIQPPTAAALAFGLHRFCSLTMTS